MSRSCLCIWKLQAAVASGLVTQYKYLSLLWMLHISKLEVENEAVTRHAEVMFFLILSLFTSVFVRGLSTCHFSQLSLLDCFVFVFLHLYIFCFLSWYLGVFFYRPVLSNLRCMWSMIWKVRYVIASHSLVLFGPHRARKYCCLTGLPFIWESVVSLKHQHQSVSISQSCHFWGNH